MKAWHKMTVVAIIGIVIGGFIITWAANRQSEPPEPKALVAPGEMDSHYSFMSGGKGGDVRVFTVPSMRLVRLIPVFSPSAQYSYGWPVFQGEGGHSLFEQSGGQKWGDTHHPVLSRTGGEYDGQWLYVQDLPHGRVARIDLRFLETKHMANVPNMTTAAGLAFVDRRGANGKRYVIASGESASDRDDGIVSFLDPETLETRFQVTGPKVTVLRAGHNGRYAFGAAPDADAVIVIDVLKAVNKAKKAGTAAGTKQQTPVVIDGKQRIISLAEVSSPTGVAVRPDSRYVVAGTAGTEAAVIEAASGEVAARPELGKEPVHSTFDSRGNVFTSLRGEDKVLKWRLNAALNGGEYRRGEVRVHSRPGYLEVTEGRTTAPGKRWMLVYNRGGTERFLDVRMDVQNVQVVDISSESMQVVKDSPVEPTVTDAVTVDADKVNPRGVYTFAENGVLEDESKVTRTGEHSVKVDLTAKRSEYGLDKFTVKEGDTVRLKVTNIERVKDIIHGLAINEYNINITLPPGRTRIVEFVADQPGVYHYYCTIFCSALHLEMRGRMVVEPRSAG